MRLRDAGLIAVALCPPHDSAAIDHRDFVCVARIVTPTFFAPAANHIQIQGMCRARVVSARQMERMLSSSNDRNLSGSIHDDPRH